MLVKGMKKDKRVLSQGEKNAIKIMGIVAVFAILTFSWILYANDYYHAEPVARKAMMGTEQIEVDEKEDYYIFSKKKTESDKGIIFYPGGKVEETAYAPMLIELAEYGYEVYLVKMPAKLAIFGMNAADDIMEKATHIEGWTMMGHSLGGAMAASYSAKNDDKVDQLVLLAAYSTEDLSTKEIKVFSFYGTEDQVLNMEKYESCFSNFPEAVIEEVIEGGNHANYAHYGAQEGDGAATITREEQQECVLDIFLNAQE